MQLAITIVTSLVALAGLAYKFWSEKRKVSSLEGDLKVANTRVVALETTLSKQTEASKERGKYVATLERGIADHLKECNTPLAAWANSLLGVRKPTKGDPGK